MLGRPGGPLDPSIVQRVHDELAVLARRTDERRSPSVSASRSWCSAGSGWSLWLRLRSSCLGSPLCTSTPSRSCSPPRCSASVRWGTAAGRRPPYSSVQRLPPCSRPAPTQSSCCPTSPENPGTRFRQVLARPHASEPRRPRQLGTDGRFRREGRFYPCAGAPRRHRSPAQSPATRRWGAV